MIARVATMIAALISLGAVIGCASAGAWNYSPAAAELSPSPLSQSRVAVLPFDDQRGSRNRNTILLYLIPIMPVGPFAYERIESGAGYLTHASYQIRPTEDLARAVVAELKAANIFSEVFYTEREQEPNVDLFIQGRITEMTYEGGVISYGLSVYGPNLWLLGLPAGYTTNTLSVSLQLRSSTGEVLWESTPFHDEWKLTSGLYYNWGKEFNGYPQMMREAAKQWVDGLSTYVRSVAR